CTGTMLHVTRPATITSRTRHNTRYASTPTRVAAHTAVVQRGRPPGLSADGHGLVAITRIGDDRQVELPVFGARESRVPVTRPLHRRADAVPVAEVHVVTHADLVAVIDDRAPRQREQQAVQQLDAAAVAVE